MSVCTSPRAARTPSDAGAVRSNVVRPRTAFPAWVQGGSQGPARTPECPLIWHWGSGLPQPAGWSPRLAQLRLTIPPHQEQERRENDHENPVESVVCSELFSSV